VTAGEPDESDLDGQHHARRSRRGSIDNRAFQWKRAFTFVMVLFSLSETGGRESMPLVTIPAG
jgi:hypothetical protein